MESFFLRVQTQEWAKDSIWIWLQCVGESSSHVLYCAWKSCLCNVIFNHYAWSHPFFPRLNFVNFHHARTSTHTHPFHKWIIHGDKKVFRWSCSLTVYPQDKAPPLLLYLATQTKINKNKGLNDSRHLQFYQILNEFRDQQQSLAASLSWRTARAHGTRGRHRPFILHSVAGGLKTCLVWFKADASSLQLGLSQVSYQTTF